MKNYRLIFLLYLIVSIVNDINAKTIENKFSTAGFFTLDNSPRQAVSLNPAWRFYKGNVNGAENKDYDDSSWQVVSLPNGIETLPLEASGGVNYRGEVWYRKHFSLDDSYKDKRIVLYFEAIMGKSKIWVNGNLVSEHFGGYLPISIDITKYCDINNENVISVWADNSDDPNYPPGKSQTVLDFCYFGGIYRDCWLYTTSDVYITDANMVDKIRNGGILTYCEKANKKTSTLNIQLNIQNDKKQSLNSTIIFELSDKEGNIVSSKMQKIKLLNNKTIKDKIIVDNPNLWSPDTPYLYNLTIKIKSEDGNLLDAYKTKVGLRTIEFNPSKGLILNEEVFPRKLIGANRHQDYALIGNALSNSLHWRDAKKLKSAGLDIIRNAHYPQDPAFMEACDELGLFVIVNTPGWQFWNENDIFKERVYSDIRNMIRRDRNHPSIFLWEPILNETNYPDYFAKKVHTIVKEELPSNNYTAADLRAKGAEYFDIKFNAPLDENSPSYNKNDIYFTREWGDNVDDWNSHNSPSRVARQWGEHAQLIQAHDYGRSPNKWASIDILYETNTNHIGGCLWHSFDHQRGYHPDPFYGGIMDAFRRPKYSYYMFKGKSHKTEPMVFIANIMSPFSPEDVTVYSNCEEVRLTTQYGENIRTYKIPEDLGNKPYPIIKFKDAYNFMTDKKYARANEHEKSYLFAEGLNNGQVVAKHKVYPSRRSSNINLIIDTEDLMPIANGGDLVTIVAQVTDAIGTVKRLNNTFIKFELEGKGRLIGAEKPVPVLWGEACVIVQTTTKSGKVKIKASMEYEGDTKPNEQEIEFSTEKSPIKLLYDTKEESYTTVPLPTHGCNILTEEDRKNINEEFKKVELQQEQFGEKNN